MKDKIIKGLIRGACLSVFYLIFDYISRHWGLVETRQFLYILIMILYLWKDNWTQKKPTAMGFGKKFSNLIIPQKENLVNGR